MLAVPGQEEGGS